MANLSVRKMRETDIPHMVRYWTQGDPILMERMAVDTSAIPKASELTTELTELLLTKDEKCSVCYSVWQVGEKSVGFASLKNIRWGKSGEMHLHMWDDGFRGKGYGGVLFSLSALHFYERFQLNEITCEPSANNPLPNKMLTKAGYPLISRRFGRSSALSAECELNTYAIRREIAQDCIVLNLRQLKLD